MFDKIKEIFFSGLRLIVPLFLVIFLIQKIYELVIGFLDPIVNILPEIPFFAQESVDLRAFVTFFVVIFLCGFLLRLGLGNFITRLLLDVLIKIFPGSLIFDLILKEKADVKSNEYDNVAMMFLDEGWVFGIIIEEMDDGFIMLFVPGAPIPTSGTLYLMPEDKIKRVNVPVHTALTNIWHLGKNADNTIIEKIKE